MAPAGKRKTPTHRLRVGDFESRKIGAMGLSARDPYHLALTIGWPAFMVVLIVVYAAVTTLFALIYWLMPGPITAQDISSFRNAMFFSFEVLSTSGYVGMLPQAATAKVIATVEIIIGLAFIAIMMGLVFVRFSRAKARLVFADKVVVCPHNGTPTLMIRVGNGRAHAMTDTNASLNALIKETTKEGNEFYNVHDLPFTRPYTPYFPLIMTLLHPIDRKSALYGMATEDIVAKQVVLFLSFETRDPSLASTVHELRTYGPNDIVFGVRFVDAISTAEDGRPVADLGMISLIEPVKP